MKIDTLNVKKKIKYKLWMSRHICLSTLLAVYEINQWHKMTVIKVLKKKKRSFKSHLEWAPIDKTYQDV